MKKKVGNNEIAAKFIVWPNSQAIGANTSQSPPPKWVKNPRTSSVLHVLFDHMFKHSTLWLTYPRLSVIRIGIRYRVERELQLHFGLHHLTKWTAYPILVGLILRWTLSRVSVTCNICSKVLMMFVKKCQNKTKIPIMSERYYTYTPSYTARLKGTSRSYNYFNASSRWQYQCANYKS